MKNLENYGVQEINAEEIRETDGGFLGILLAAAATYLVYETLGNWEASNAVCNAGVEAGYNYNK